MNENRGMQPEKKSLVGMFHHDFRDETECFFDFHDDFIEPQVSREVFQ